MSRRLNLISTSEPGAPKNSGRLANEGVVNASAEPARRLGGSHSRGALTPSRQSGALAINANARAAHRPSPTGSPSDSPSDSMEAIPEIELDQLSAGDQIVIFTTHSDYIFLVSDPAKHLGMVIGGVFGNYAVEAYLRVLPVAGDCRLRAGSRAVFYVGSSVGCRRVTTSIITNLVLRRPITEPLC